MSVELDRVRNATPFEPDTNLEGMSSPVILPFLGLIGAAADFVPPYWSPRRDSFLRGFATQSDPIKLTTSTFIQKVTNIPINIAAKDRNVRRHVRQAEQIQRNLMHYSGLFKGFRHTMKQVVNDYLGQDNGAFILVLGNGPEDRPIVGPALGLLHLDSQYCQRTGDIEFPVIYHHQNGKAYKLHYTRLIDMVNMPSPRRDHYGIGLCPVSCCLDAARELKDVIVNSQESFGSRPMRRALYVEKGASMEQLQVAVRVAEDKMDAEGLTRFAKTLLLAPKNANSELKLNTLDLVGTPNGFDRMDVSLFDMAFLAAAFGLNLGDLAITFRGSSSDSQAGEVMDRKGWGKGVGEFIDSFREQLNAKVLPEHLHALADNVDDAQDEHQARIRQTRSTARERDLRAGITTIRIERELMMDHGEIREEQFEDMELLDGRLPNGLDLFSLFSTQNPMLVPLLDLGVENPTLLGENDAATMLDVIHEKVKECWLAIESANVAHVGRLYRQALAALEKLRDLYQAEQELEAEMLLAPVPPSTENVDPDPSVLTPEPGDEQVVQEEVVDGAE